MVDMLQTGLDRLDVLRRSHMSQSVAYKRGLFTVNISATLGATDYEVADMDGLLVKAKSTDFIVRAADLNVGAGVFLPEIGDDIRVTRGLEVLVYEVLDLGGTGHYRPSDAHGVSLRIHTKQIDTE